MKQVCILKAKYETSDWHNIAVFTSFVSADTELNRLKQQYSNLKVIYSIDTISLYES